MRPILLALLLLWAIGAARADDALARVKARGVLRVATDATYQPFEFIENGEVRGFDRDIGDAIGKALGVRVQWTSMEWAGVLPSVTTGKADLILSGVSITEERKKAYTFSRPYFLSGQVIVRRKGSPIATPADVLRSGGTAAVQQETTSQIAMEKAGLPADRIHRFDTVQDALLDVRNGKSTVAVGDLPALSTMIRRDYPELEISPAGIFVRENLGIVGAPDARDLIAAVNRALDRVLVDGSYAAAHAAWMGSPLSAADVAALDAVKDQGSAIPREMVAALDTPAPPPADDAAPAVSALAIRWDLLPKILPLLIDGAKLTVSLTVLTILIGVPLGLVVALCRLAPAAPLRWAAGVYVETIRGTPLLMQIYVLYFVLPAVLPALGERMGPFASGLMALSLNAAAYVAEIFRAGIGSVDAGQREAARALGMSGSQAMRHVVLPQTFQRVVPPLTNEAVALLKDSSLVSVVALSELTRVGKELVTRNGAPTTVYLAVALLYLAMTLPLTALSGRLERRLQKGMRP